MRSAPERVRPDRDLKHIEHALLLRREHVPAEAARLLEDCQKEADSASRIDGTQTQRCLRDIFLILLCKVCSKPCLDEEPLPEACLQYVPDIEMMEGAEALERQLLARILLKRGKRRDEPCPCASCPLQALEHTFLCHTLELDIAALRRFGKAFLDLRTKARRRMRKKCPQLRRKVVAPVLLADEIENRQALLAGCQAQPSSELLHEDGERLGRAQEQHRVYLGDIDTFVVDVDRKDDLESA